MFDKTYLEQLKNVMSNPTDYITQLSEYMRKQSIFPIFQPESQAGKVMQSAQQMGTELREKRLDK